MLSRCHIFRQHTASMAHASADHVIYMCAYLFCCHFMMSRCPIFSQHTAKIVHLSADHVIYMCVFWSFCHLMLSRCRIFNQHTAKIARIFRQILLFICVFVRLSFLAVYESHLLLAYCQGIPSICWSYHLHAFTCFYPFYQ